MRIDAAPAYYIADIPKGRALKSKKIIFVVLCAGYCKIFCVQMRVYLSAFIPPLYL